MNEESGKGVWAVAGKRVKSAIKQTEQWHELRECAKAFVIWKKTQKLKPIKKKKRMPTSVQYLTQERFGCWWILSQFCVDTAF